MRGLIAYQGKLNAQATKSSEWSGNVKLIKFAIRLKKLSQEGIFADHTCSGTPNNYILNDEIKIILFLSRSERCPGAECLFHQRSLGLHKMDNRPTDSTGNICGEGTNAGKPYSLFFDLTLCARLNSTSQPCPSVQVLLDGFSIQFQELAVLAHYLGVCSRMPSQICNLDAGISLVS